MSFTGSRRSLDEIDQFEPGAEAEQGPGLDDSAASDAKPVERFDQPTEDRLTLERETVVGCCKELESVAGAGVRIPLVSECVVTRLCPNATTPDSPPPPPYCSDFRANIRSTVEGSKRPVATDVEAAAAAAEAAAEGLDALVLRVPEVYRHNKQLYEAGHTQTVTVVQRLMTLAYFKMTEPLSIIGDKSFTPDNGDKRTYVSLATYCWPSNPEDLKNPKGPWECKDGLPFPGRHIIAPDFEKLMMTQTKALVLASAYYFSGNEEFAHRAAATLRAFYTDPDTGMRPNLKYAQLRAGSKKGATTGTIDNHHTYAVFDAVALLQGSAAWTEADLAALMKWFSEYIQHLQSDHCRNESLQENNHGTFYDVQYLAILSFLRRRKDAVEFITNVVKPRLRAQIAGSVMATEMTRPKSYSYHSFILEGYVQLAMLAEKFDINLWDISAASGNSMLDAWDWMVPHWCDRSESIWPVEQIDNPKLDLNRPQEYTGAVYTHVMATAGAGDAYTLRGRHYALLYQSLRGGPDPKHEMDEARALIRQLGLVKFDDCFITFCPDREVKPIDPPSYPAVNCIPSLDTPLPALDATKGPFYHVKTASDILPALIKGDPPGAMLDIKTWLGPSATARAARIRYMASTKIAAHSVVSVGAMLCVMSLVVALALRTTLRAVRKKRTA